MKKMADKYTTKKQIPFNPRVKVFENFAMKIYKN